MFRDALLPLIFNTIRQSSLNIKNKIIKIFYKNNAVNSITYILAFSLAFINVIFKQTIMKENGVCGLMKYFCIDLDSSKPEVMEYSGAALETDLEFFGAKNPLELSNFDRRVFDSERDAVKYLRKFLSIRRNLKRIAKKGDDAPCMLYKRHYMIQTILGEKLYTERDYLKKFWTPGTMFYLHDQINFLKVKLKKVSEIENGYRYDFLLA
jgi:hypothetical protein